MDKKWLDIGQFLGQRRKWPTEKTGADHRGALCPSTNVLIGSSMSELGHE
jgi:hypothetical protein